MARPKTGKGVYLRKYLNAKKYAEWAQMCEDRHLKPQALLAQIVDKAIDDHEANKLIPVIDEQTRSNVMGRVEQEMDLSRDDIDNIRAILDTHYKA